ncbi:MAG: asparagine synthase C-terminal domain-containing protein [Candidatus Thorarchaeota archaeon]
MLHPLVGISGLISKSTNKEALDILQKMSKKISHRGEERTFEFTLDEDSTVVIKVRSHPFESFLSKADSEGILLLEEIGQENKESDIPLEAYSPNSFLLAVNREGIEVRRHSRSMRALYYVKTDQVVLFASERKALWEVTNQSSKSLQPGHRLRTTGFGEPTIIEDEKEESPLIVRNRPREKVIEQLAAALKESFSRITGRRVGVLFSGGVDSSLVALLAQEVCEEVLLYSASSQQFHDRVAAASSAEELGMNLNSIEINEGVVWEILPHLIYAIESAHLLDVEIALPFYLASKQASEDGISIMLSGQGPDELFAGYARHVKILEEEGQNALDTQLWNEAKETHEVNIERDDRAIAVNGIGSFFPYLSTSFVDLALSIPSEWKIRLGPQPERKVIFRELARHLGLPESICISPKKATQYSSGSSRILMKSLLENVNGMKDIPKKRQKAKAQEYLYSLASELGMHNATSEK